MLDQANEAAIPDEILQGKRPQADTPNTDWTARIGPLEKQIDERQHVQAAFKERLRFDSSPSFPPPSSSCPLDTTKVQ